MCEELNQPRLQLVSQFYEEEGSLAKYIGEKEKQLVAEMTERYGGSDKVFVSNIRQKRESYKELRVYAMIHVPVKNSEFEGYQKVEGYVQCSSLSEMSAVSNLLFAGITAAIDKNTLEILETI